MKPITIVLAYYENAKMLCRQCDNFRSFPNDIKDHLRLIVVDDGSPKHPAQFEDIGFPFDIYRVSQDVRWNQDACRNIGVHHAETEWVLLTDMDHMIPLHTAKGLIRGGHDKGTVYRFGRVSLPGYESYKPHPNSWFLTKNTYDKAGGYDERFAGWYGTDSDIRERLKTVARILDLKDTLVRVPREVVPDASTTTYKRKTPEDGEAIKRIKAERAGDPDWRPLRMTFPYVKVHPC